MVTDAFTLVNWAFASSLFILFVLLLRRTGLMKKLSRTLSYALWLPVLLRLLIPVQMLSLPIYPHLPESGIVGETVTAPERDSGTYDGTLTVSPNQGAPLTDARPSTPSGTGDNYSHLYNDGDKTSPDETGISRAALALLVWQGGAVALAAIIAATNLSFTAGLRRRRVLLENAGASLPVYTVERLGSPCLAGLFRPAIYLSPEDAQNPLHLRHIVAHEETHRQNGDPVWSLLRAAALCLHWYNPLVWYAAALSKRDAELACDERTLRRLGGAERTAYGETLLSLTMAKPNAGALLSCSTQMVGGKRTLRERIEGIAHDRRTRTTAAFAVIAVLALALVFAFGKQKPADEYDLFMQRAEAAERVAYHLPPYSSYYYPALTDAETVAEMKEFLLQLERADESDVPEGELNIFMSSGFSLDGEYRYYLVDVDGVTLLYGRTDGAEGMKDEDFTLIGKYAFPIATHLLDLASGQEGRNAAIEANALYFLTSLQTEDISSAVLTTNGSTETSVDETLCNEIFYSLHDIAKNEALFREVTDEGTLRNYPVYDSFVTLTLTDGEQLMLYPIFTQKGNVLMSLVSETESRRFVLENADTIYRVILIAAGVGDARDEQREQPYRQASVSGSETDLDYVARSIGEQIATSWLAVSDETVWKPVDAYLASANVFDIYYGENGAGQNFCADLIWKLKFDSRFSMNYWEVGAGLFGPDENDYYSFGLQCLFRIGDDGRWHMAECGSGGYSVDCGIDLYHDGTIDCASIVKAFFLTEGWTHDYLLPNRFCETPASERAKLSGILDGYTTTQASDFVRAVADHLAQYPSYHDLTAETFYAELPDKYKDFAPILAAEPFWTGDAGDGRFALYDYGKAEWALVLETGDVREIVTTYFRDASDPNDSIAAYAMDDLLGFPGVVVQTDATGSHKSYDYYAWTDYGVQYVANSFGFYDDLRSEIASVDLDGDGRSELITNNTYGADGAERVRVFRWNGSESEVGSPNWRFVGVTLDGIGATNYRERYDAARGTVTLTYDKGSGTKTAELPLAPESFMWLAIDEL